MEGICGTLTWIVELKSCFGVTYQWLKSLRIRKTTTHKFALSTRLVVARNLDLQFAIFGSQP